MDIALPAIELAVQFKLAKAHRAERLALNSATFEGAIRPIHRALIVDAVLEAKHMTDLMHHRTAGSLHPLYIAFLRRHFTTHLCMPMEREDTTLILR